MKLFYISAIVLMLISGCFAQDTKRIEEIGKIYAETNARIAECEADGSTSGTYLTEINVNKNGGQYPAVGIYNTVVKFYYTYGNREKDPYPNRLIRILEVTKRSSQTETREFTFDEKGKLAFYRENVAEEPERKIYFQHGKVIRLLVNSKPVNIGNSENNKLWRDVVGSANQFNQLFNSTLKF